MARNQQNAVACSPAAALTLLAGCTAGGASDVAAGGSDRTEPDSLSADVQPRPGRPPRRARDLAAAPVQVTHPGRDPGCPVDSPSRTPTTPTPATPRSTPCTTGCARLGRRDLGGDTTVTFRAATSDPQGPARPVRRPDRQPGTARRSGRSATPRPATASRCGPGRSRGTRPTCSRSSTPAGRTRPRRRASAATWPRGWGGTSTRHGSVYTFQEPYGAFTWYPVNDQPSDKALYDADITTHGDDVAVFNGELVGRASHGDATTNRWHLDAPAASYLITLAIGPYTRVDRRHPERDAHLLLAAASRRVAAAGLESEGSHAFDWLTAHAGPYPFSTLGVVVVDGDSAMETQTMITLSAAALQPPRRRARARDGAPVVRRQPDARELAGRVAQRGLGDVHAAVVRERHRPPAVRRRHRPWRAHRPAVARSAPVRPGTTTRRPSAT